MTDVKSLQTNTLADGLIERASSMLDGTPSQLCTKKMVINRGKKNEAPNKVKPVKNTPSFLKTIPMEKEVLPSHKLQGHAYEYQNPFKLKSPREKLLESIESLESLIQEIIHIQQN